MQRRQLAVEIECPSCGATVARSEMMKHMLYACAPKGASADGLAPCPRACGVRLAPGELEAHGAACLEAEIDCPRGCAASVLRRRLPTHVKYICVYRDAPRTRDPRETACPLACGQRMLPEDVGEHVGFACPRRPPPPASDALFRCPHGCGALLSLDERARHSAACLAEPVECPRGCGARFPSAAAEVHLQGTCPKREVDDPVVFDDDEYVARPCPNDCGAVLLPRYAAEHLVGCSAGGLPCPNGCGRKLTPSDAEAHLLACSAAGAYRECRACRAPYAGDESVHLPACGDRGKLEQMRRYEALFAKLEGGAPDEAEALVCDDFHRDAEIFSAASSEWKKLGGGSKAVDYDDDTLAMFADQNDPYETLLVEDREERIGPRWDLVRAMWRRRAADHYARHPPELERAEAAAPPPPPPPAEPAATP